MADVLQDLRYGLRQLRAHPGFTAAAGLCIALGIGANTATFSFADALLFRTPDVKEPERLVRLFVSYASGLHFGSFSYPDYVDFRDRCDAFSGVVAEALRPLHLSTGQGNEKIAGSIVSGNYFSELGVPMAVGRAFVPEEDRTPGSHPVAVLSHGLWQRRFGGDPSVLGKSLLLNGHPYTVIGVGPEGFHGTNIAIRTDIWVPLMMQEQLVPGSNRLDSRGDHWIQFVMGRLRPGVTIEQARASTNALMNHLAKEYPGTNTGKSIDVYPEAEAGLHPQIRGGLVGFMGLMFAVVGLVLLLACANVAGLLLTRMASRQREVALRLALGAGRFRLARQLLAESVLLSLSAGAVGFLLAHGLVRWIQSFRPPTDMPLYLDVRVGTSVLGFTALIALLTGVLFGLAPALQATKTDLVSSLKEGVALGRGGASFFRKALVVGQVAVSVVLLIGAGLALQSLQAARRLDLGFNPDHLLVAAMDLGLQGYDEDRGRQFRRELKQRLESLPGMVAVGYAVELPLHFSGRQRGVLPEGYEVPEGANPPSIDYNFVDGGYFRAMGIPLLKGRSFTERDDEGAPPVMIVNQTFAERFWPGQDALGKRVRTAGRPHEVIGIVPTGKYSSLGEDPKPFFYLPAAQHYRATTILHVRTQTDPSRMLETLRRQIRRLDPDLPVSDLKTMHAALGFALLPARMAAGVLAAFGALALLLAAIGLYGVMAYSVSRAVRDIGIRMALGARPKDVLRYVIRNGMGLAGTGLLIGLALGYALTRLMRGVLYGVRPGDPPAYLIACAALLAVALLACFLPARRAAKLDPVLALRQE